MRTALGLILALAGGALILYGIGAALMELFGVYQGAMNDALAVKPDAEQEASRAMLRSVMVGAAGIPLFLAGIVMLKISVFQRMARRKRGV